MPHAIASTLPPPPPPRLIQGDALDVLRKLPTASVDALITDPPYSSGGMFRGDRAQDPGDKYQQSGVQHRRNTFEGDVKDQRSWIMWCREWLAESRRVMRPGAPFCVFVDWRQLPALTDAVQFADLVWRGTLSWDKGPASRCPGPGRFRHQCEFVVWGSNGPMPHRSDVGVLPGSYTVPEHDDRVDVVLHALDGSADPLARELAAALRAGAITLADLAPPPADQLVGGETIPVLQRDKFHLTGKPTALMRKLAKICSPRGVILDPFMGSGTTGVGAIAEGRGFIGVERSPFHLRTAYRRIFRSTPPPLDRDRR